jgi:hypothetical protein
MEGSGHNSYLLYESSEVLPHAEAFPQTSIQEQPRETLMFKGQTANCQAETRVAGPLSEQWSVALQRHDKSRKRRETHRIASGTSSLRGWTCLVSAPICVATDTMYANPVTIAVNTSKVTISGTAGDTTA